MRPLEVLRSLTFRFIVKYVVALGGTVFVVMAAFYLYFSYSSFRELGASVVDELESLRLVYQGQGLDGGRVYLEDQQRTASAHRFFYLIRDDAGHKVAGELPADATYTEMQDGWLGFELALQDWEGAVDVDFLARKIDLGDGYNAMVARDYADIVQRARLVFSNLIRVMFATVLFGLIGGYFSAASALRQVDRLNRELSLIVRGDLARRLPLGSEQGHVRSLAGAVNEMLGQMDEFMQGVRRVADNIAHDLRTPLTRMRNSLGELRDRVDPETAARLEGIIGECDELLAAFNASLRISTLEAGSRMKVGHPVDLDALLRDVVELYEPLAQERDIALTQDGAPGLLCRGEADLLFQMFANILDNAVKYTPRGGAIHVALQAGSGDRGHCVLIGDTGPGIAPAERENVFRRFYRVESSRGQQHGHGLGLSLVQAIARHHYGAVQLGDNQPGLQVRVTLPCA